ncbi:MULTISPECIES: cytochrome d ubiquinol oxidase subunit II [Leeuwenhoekiella]|uniref:Cytochrome bd-I ubiquinol oxidase subunit 2 apoprotein n=1 Tax=Leeuwenhoekiella palythoae TaxID=573501 RepID=A0A1M5XHZ7_9FLAO|nr:MULTISPECIES: cytochrome d ubiquinol oxidase subunit II [Leeuwenhoekiella]MEE3243705.1 cytochrome d ubiquinol oxidase subunit II [Bacteroidota bacterium]RXG30031.1 cytochrome bd-I ubiquinol oxidase subunit 2 apoprotein [Leeuwenhoekiella palythoae]UBZ10176.1 cytochrome d ubiquinol oxidase subunit II [Leeuwenhoekiella palythoae]SHH98883.1 cytochrome bd-I ubiquinol oxidase subunit 2 apoprotein [Leeuwenhoekiella palythoae]
METILGIDYPTWWFLVIGGLFSGYAILDGFDFGAGAWHLFFKKELNRRIALNAVGPVWDGNEVWLVIGGGALFAGFPVMYATLFSSLYIPFMLFLIFIIFRAISIEFRGKEEMLWWRRLWDVSYSISSIMLAFLLGVVLGNVLQGFAIGENYQYTGSGFFEFLNPYAIMTGVTTLALFMAHGAIYLLLKTEGAMFDQLTNLLQKGMIFFMVSFAITTLYTLLYIPHLSDDFKSAPILFAVPVLTFLSIANVPRLASKKNYKLAFFFSSLTISLLLVLVAVELYPNLLFSTVDPKYSLDVYEAASSERSLGIMLLFVAIGGPLVLGYTFFVYRTFRGKVKLDDHSY